MFVAANQIPGTSSVFCRDGLPQPLLGAHETVALRELLYGMFRVATRFLLRARCIGELSFYVPDCAAESCPISCKAAASWTSEY